ncbi:hypothetical protein IKQ26_01780 [bacterium]|nr:hypothetical protein [bacterium]
MKDFLKALFGQEREEDKPQSLEDILDNREKTKERFAQNLREKLFFTEEEIKEVTDIIDNSYKIMDLIRDNKSFKNYGLISSQLFEMDFRQVEKDMLETLDAKIKEIMAEKVKRAKEYFNK